MLEPGKTVKTYPTHPAVFQSLQKDTIDAFVADCMILASLRSYAPNCEELEILFKDLQFGGGHYGIGVRGNDSRWRDTINTILQDMWADGSWDVLFNKWFGHSTPLNLQKEDLSFQMPCWS